MQFECFSKEKKIYPKFSNKHNQELYKIKIYIYFTKICLEKIRENLNKCFRWIYRNRDSK